MKQEKYIIVEGLSPASTGEKINYAMDRGYKTMGKMGFASYRNYDGSQKTNVIFYQPMELIEPDEEFYFNDSFDTMITKSFAQSVSKIQKPYHDEHKNGWRFKVWCGNTFHIFEYESESDARLSFTDFKAFRRKYVSLSPVRDEIKYEILKKYNLDKEAFK